MVDFQRLQLAVGTQHRFAGGQRRVRGVDKAAAVAGDAIGVGDHHAGLLACHLQVALKL
ncbi:hypothetical protein D3C78_1940590 [compost metagenome]